MTVIASIVHDGKVTMGADSAVTTYENDTREAKDTKIFKKHGLMFGFTGGVLEEQAVRYRLKAVKFRPDEDNFVEFCATTLVDAMVEAIKEHPAREIKSSGYPMDSSWLIAAPGGHCVEMNCGAVVHYSSHLNAVGCGRSLAMGSLLSTEPEKKATKAMKPEARIREAIKAASALDNWVGGRIDIESI